MSLNASWLVFGSTKSDQGVNIDAFKDSISIILYTLTIVLGIIGNSMVIWVAGVKWKPAPGKERKVALVWLVNLAVADLIFCFTRIFSLVKKLFFNHWPFGLFVCKFNGFFKYADMFCSAFMLAVISLDQARCVWMWKGAYATKKPNSASISAVARRVAVAVWALAFVLSAPYFIYRQVHVGKYNLSMCSLDSSFEARGGDNRARLALYSIRFICGFLLPLLVIVICNILTAVGIKRRDMSGKSRALKRIVILVAAFFLCWAPYHCLLLVKMVDSQNKMVKIWHPVASGVAYFHSCVNPILYYCMLASKERTFRLSVWSAVDSRKQRSTEQENLT